MQGLLWLMQCCSVCLVGASSGARSNSSLTWTRSHSQVHHHPMNRPAWLSKLRARACAGRWQPWDDRNINESGQRVEQLRIRRPVKAIHQKMGYYNNYGYKRDQIHQLSCSDPNNRPRTSSPLPQKANSDRSACVNIENCTVLGTRLGLDLDSGSRGAMWTWGWAGHHFALLWLAWAMHGR